MICKLRNSLERYADKVLFGHNNNTVILYETNLGEFLYWLSVAIMITLCMTWWIVPARMILKTICEYKFVCDKWAKL